MKFKIKDFLKHFPGFAIQTFDDREGVEKDKSLITLGRPSEYSSDRLLSLNKRGAGIFFTVNKFPLGKRTKADCQGVNAWFVESDDLSLEEQEKNLAASPLLPSFVVRSKKSLHAYWLASDASVENFVTVQQGLIEKFTGDPACKDISRVLRIPGFSHNKSEPFMVELVSANPERVYTEKQMLDAFKAQGQAVVSNTPKTQVSSSIFWQTIVALNCKTVLMRLSGTEIVNREIYTFRKRGGTGGEYIDINNKPANCWIDKDGFIGSGSKAGPTWIQWLLYYGLSKADIAQFAKNYLADLLPAEVVGGIDSEFDKEDLDSKKWQPENFSKASDFIGKIVDIFNSPPSVFTWGTKNLDEKLPAIEKGHYIILFGQNGCLSGDTFINFQIRDAHTGKMINHKGGTIKHLYERVKNIKNVGKCEYLMTKNDVDYFVPSINSDNFVIQNKIFDVIKCGTKKCYEVKTKSGKKISCTKDHKFYVGDGAYKSLENLKIGDAVFIHNHSRLKKFKNNARTRYPELLVKYHPSKRKKIISGKYVYSRINRCHAVVEASMNNMCYNDYVNFLNNESEDKINKLKIIPKNYDVHHINEDPHDDSLANLRLMTGKEHDSYHSKKNNALRFTVSQDKIVDIVYVGKKETYDIKCFYPNNNYIANNIVVHNSGKTLLALFLARENAKVLGPGSVAFVSLEMSKEQLLKRYVRDRAGIDKEQYRNRKFNSDIVARILPELDNINFVGIDGGEVYTVKDLARIIDKTKAKFLVVDNLNKIRGTGKSELEITQNVSQEILEMTRKYKIPVIIVHHANKPSNLEKVPASKKLLSEKQNILDISNKKTLLKEMMFRGMSGMRGTNKTADDADIILEVARVEFGAIDRPILTPEKYATGLSVYKDREFDAKGKEAVFFWRGSYYDTMEEVAFQQDFNPEDLWKDEQTKKQIYYSEIAKGNVVIDTEVKLEKPLEIDYSKN